MLSLQQAIEIKESIKSYLQATFTFRKREVARAFDEFIEHPTLGMFKGPYVSLRLPFVKAEQGTIDQIPLTIKRTDTLRPPGTILDQAFDTGQRA